MQYMYETRFPLAVPVINTLIQHHSNLPKTKHKIDYFLFDNLVVHGKVTSIGGSSLKRIIALTTNPAFVYQLVTVDKPSNII